MIDSLSKTASGATTGFTYRAVTRTGRQLRGHEGAASAGALRKSLESRGLTVLDIGASDTIAAVAPLTFGFQRRREVLEVTRAMSALLPAGLPLARALAASAAIATGRVADALGAIRVRVERGEPLSTALADHPACFSPLYVGLIRAGERSGDLAGAFGRLAAQLEREDQIRSKLLSAMMYPLLLAIAGGLAVIVLMVFVMPRFVELLQGTGATLPRSTALLLALSAGMRRFWPLWLVLGVAIVLVIAWVRITPEGRRAGATLLLGIPGVNHYRRDVLAARFARLVAVLLGGGAPLLTALDSTAECLTDPLVQEEVGRIRARVREGASLRDAVYAGSLFPPLLGQFVSVGEESAQLHGFLSKAADMLDERTQRRLEQLVGLAEPAMIVAFGGVVGFVALSLLQAIYGVNAGSLR